MAVAIPLTTLVDQAGVGWLGGGNVHAFRFQASDHDQLQDWGWKEHDGSSYGFQHILDLENQLVSPPLQDSGLAVSGFNPPSFPGT